MSLLGVLYEARVYGVGAKVYGAGARVYGVGARVYGSLVILESAQGPNPFFFFFWETFIRLGGLLGPGFGPGLDNSI